MLHRLFTFLSALSLLLCLAMCVLWARSRQHADCIGRVIGGNRYTIISSAGMITVYGPPPAAASASVRTAAEQVVAALHERQVCFYGYYKQDENGPRMEMEWQEPLRDTPAERAEDQFARNDIARPLLAALEDPRRMMAAHVILIQAWLERNPARPQSRPIPGQYLGKCAADIGDDSHTFTPWSEVELDGLKVTLSRWENVTPERKSWGYQSLGEWEHGLTGEWDVAQLPSIRDRWHRRLDVQHAAMAHWQVAIALALLPLANVGRRIRLRVRVSRRRRANCCTACGYDLRATAERCPECGALPEPN